MFSQVSSIVGFINTVAIIFWLGLLRLPTGSPRRRVRQQREAVVLAAWLAVVCLYPDGVCELDFAHPVSRRFWSEDNGFPDLPPVTGPTLNALWFEELGFTILRMNPAIRLTVATDRPKHLKTI